MNLQQVAHCLAHGRCPKHFCWTVLAASLRGSHSQQQKVAFWKTRKPYCSCIWRWRNTLGMVVGDCFRPKRFEAMTGKLYLFCPEKRLWGHFSEITEAEAGVKKVRGQEPIVSKSQCGILKWKTRLSSVCVTCGWLPWWLRWEEICLKCRRPGFDHWLGKIPWRREWQPTPVFFPGKFHGQRSLVGCSPTGSERVRLDWATNTLTHGK